MSTDRKNLLVELFVEELPPKALKKLGEVFAAALAESLKAQGLIADDAGQWRAVARLGSFCPQHECAVLVPHALHLIRLGIVKAPLNAELIGREVIGQRDAVRNGRAVLRLRDRLRQIAAARAKPAVRSPFDRIEE